MGNTTRYVASSGVEYGDDTDQRRAKGPRCMANIMQSSACNDRGTQWPPVRNGFFFLVFLRRFFRDTTFLKADDA